MRVRLLNTFYFWRKPKDKGPNKVFPLLSKEVHPVPIAAHPCEGAPVENIVQASQDYPVRIV